MIHHLNSFLLRLLGLNGAGKTTTFKILTGEINATSGNAYINGYDIDQDRFEARRNLGFCKMPNIIICVMPFELA